MPTLTNNQQAIIFQECFCTIIGYVGIDLLPVCGTRCQLGFGAAFALSPLAVQQLIGKTLFVMCCQRRQGKYSQNHCFCHVLDDTLLLKIWPIQSLEIWVNTLKFNLAQGHSLPTLTNNQQTVIFQECFGPPFHILV